MEYHDTRFAADRQKSLKAVQDYLSILRGVREVRSWEELFRSLFRKEHLLALQDASRNTDLCHGHIIPRLLDLLLLSPGCRSKDTVSRILKGHSECAQDIGHEPRSPEALFSRFREALLGGEATEALSFISAPADYWRSVRCEIKGPTEFFEGYYHFERLAANVKWMNVLVTYGLVKRLEWTEFHLVSICRYCIFDRLLHLGNLPLRERIERSFIITETLVENIRRMISRNPRGSRRIPLIVLSVEAASNLLSSASEFFQDRLLEAYLSTLPDPLVSEEEVREFLLLLLDGLHEDPNVVDRIVESFVGLFGSRAYKPRSLCHLCRCTVRDNIVRNSPVTLPASVQCLHLSNRIKNFILCSPGFLSEQ